MFLRLDMLQIQSNHKARLQLKSVVIYCMFLFPVQWVLWVLAAWSMGPVTTWDTSSPARRWRMTAPSASSTRTETSVVTQAATQHASSSSVTTTRWVLSAGKSYYKLIKPDHHMSLCFASKSKQHLPLSANLIHNLKFTSYSVWTHSNSRNNTFLYLFYCNQICTKSDYFMAQNRKCNLSFSFW